MIEIKLGNLDGTELEESNEARILIGEILMLLFTHPGDVYGEPDMGIDLKQFLWEVNFSNYELERYVMYQINKYILMTKFFDIKAQVKLIKGELNDSAFIDIIINNIPVIGVFVK